ncbi:head GIN domain-containing protein [Hymenobacter chitinivorans]|uniref:Putative autotransporter adhesin-like protein n=1 Tax=Hymenobacter chitinivorans DSM 11115 TaxID=1121954 RepID=A0A2M9AS62_9BACT|nr:head GIN domain-containing protein [Hymenobacter chitinivorans]PJJ48544.1 putative autotransporter adhesin-like protein [Hymenobacter chitinivorans DSM 11115]
MKTAIRPLLLGALLCSAAAAQAQVRQSRPVEPFQAVQAGGGIDVVLTQGPAAAVVVDAASEAQPHVVTSVKNGALTIGWDTDRSWRSLLAGRKLGPVRVYVTCPRLTALSVSGGSDARSETPLTAEDIRLGASGGSDMQLTLTAKNIICNVSGGGDMTLSGRVERQKVAVSGGSDYHAFALQSTTAEVSASGGSDANISVDGELVSSASGGSDVRYKGGARLVSSQASGGSSTRPAR